MLKQKYNREDFLEFQKQFLPDFKKDIRRVTSSGLKATENVVLLGQSEQLDLHVFEFTHKATTDARVSLAADGFRVMKDHDVSHALAVYQSETSDDWRLSLMTATLDINQKGRVTPTFSNPRRYSFFLGPEARIHTPEEFLVKQGRVKDAQDLENRFDVEIVTKEFFQKYKALFESLQKFLDKDHAFTAFAEKNSIDIDAFAKKILGQIVFCYFLQKKGWLGAKKGEDVIRGDKDFMRSLFTRADERKENFYNECLEPLFYDSLNAAPEEPGDFYREYFDSQIPFLNGGLFEPLENYDWKKSFLHIPDALFSNKQGTGILDVFDLYNFTVYEDDPVDREVSVDPEMLGKVFENLLPENIRKGQGAYYTPREIVHYMCQESLINHLVTETGVGGKDIRKLITSKEHLFTNGEGLVFSPAEAEKLDNALANIKVCDPACGSGAFLVGMLHEIVMARRVLNPKKHEYHLKKEAIQNSIYGVDIDPGAVEIAKLRLWLSLVVDYELEDIEPLPNLDYKIMCGNSLLEELIVGDETIKLFDERLLRGGKKKSKTAFFDDNDLKGEKGSSAREEKLQHLLNEKHKEMLRLNNEGKLIPEIKRMLDKEVAEIMRELAPKKKNKTPDYSVGLFTEKAEEYFAQLRELHRRYFSESDSNIKKRIRKSIEQIEFEFIRSSVQEKIDGIETRTKNLNLNIPGDRKKNEELAKRKLECLAVPDMVKSSKAKPYFLWKLNFFEVFQEEGGFDLVIANPPYLRVQGLQETQPELVPAYKKFYQAAQGSFDLYGLFIERGFNLLSDKGNFSYIVPHKFFQATFGKSLRGLLNQAQALYQIVRFGAEQVFDSATTYTCLLFLSRQRQSSFTLHEVKNLLDIDRTLNAIRSGISDPNYESAKQPQPVSDDWDFHIGKVGDILSKLAEQGVTLGDITRKIFQGIATSADKIYILDICKTKQSSMICYSKALECEVELENGFIKPFLMGKDVHRYEALEKKRIVIFPYMIKDGSAELMSQAFIRKNFPLSWDYLLRNKKALSDRERGRMYGDDFYAYIYPKNLTEFETIKILTPEIALGCQMTLDATGEMYHTTKVYSFVFDAKVKDDLLYLLGVLNSKVLWFFLRSTGYILRGGYFTFKTDYLRPFPIACSLSKSPPSAKEQAEISALVKKRLDYGKSPEGKTSDIEEIERAINAAVYRLYRLTDDEIKIVEESTKRD